MKKNMILILMAALLAGAAAWMALPPRHADAPEGPPIEDGHLTYNGENWYPKPRLDTVLFLGIDAVPGQANTQQADFLALLIVDRDSRSFTLLHLNRDTLCDIPVLDQRGIRTGYKQEQLALAHAYGTGQRDSCINTVHAVRRLLYDVPLEDYARIPVQSMGILNDALGGVTVTIEDDFSAIDPSLELGKTLTLQGTQAETFVRARGGMEDSSNLRRMHRQQQYLLGLLDKLESGTGALEQTVNLLAENLESSMTVSRMSQLAETVKDCTFGGIRTLPGEAVVTDTFMEFRVDETALRQLVLELFYQTKKGGVTNEE